MAIIGYHASHEQFAPSPLLQFVIQAERAGFGAVNSSDHFHPWTTKQGQSGFAFAWLGAAMQATQLPFSVVCAPGQRYHPAIVAQAIATLAGMFPQRFSVSLGTGEALNELITGDPWPVKGQRNKRLVECYQVIKRLLDGETVTHRGLVTVDHARLYSLPPEKPLLLGAAVTQETAAWVGEWAEGLITIHRPLAELRKVVQAFRGNGGAGKPVYLKVQLSYARTENEALHTAYAQWGANTLKGELLSDMPYVSDFDALANVIKPGDITDMIHISADLQRHAGFLQSFTALGFERIILHNVNLHQERFINDFGERVLPQLK